MHGAILHDRSRHRISDRLAGYSVHDSDNVAIRIPVLQTSTFRLTDQSIASSVKLITEAVVAPGGIGSGNCSERQLHQPRFGSNCPRLSGSN